MSRLFVALAAQRLRQKLRRMQHRRQGLKQTKASRRLLQAAAADVITIAALSGQYESKRIVLCNLSPRIHAGRLDTDRDAGCIVPHVVAREMCKHF